MIKTDTKNAAAEKPSLLPTNKSREALKDLDGWQSTDDHRTIYREFILHNFTSAVDLISGIRDIAEGEQHHPDLHLTQYRNLRVVLSTHDVGGLTEKDFSVASKINEFSVNPTEHRPVKQPKRAAAKKQAAHKKSRITTSKKRTTHAKKRI